MMRLLLLPLLGLAVGPRPHSAADQHNADTQMVELRVKTDDTTQQLLPTTTALAQQPPFPAADDTATTKPAVLFCSPNGADQGWIDLQYLRNLSATAGIEGDITREWGPIAPLDNFMNLTWERARQYNVLVLFGEPQGIAGTISDNVTQLPPGVNARWVQVVLRFLEAGGGLLLFPSEMNRCTQQFPTLMDALGAKIPLETIEETNLARVACLPRFNCQGFPDNRAHGGGGGGAVAHTSAVDGSHSVTKGVRGLWYPTTHPAYNAAMGGTIFVDSNWSVLINGSDSSHSVPINTSTFNPANEQWPPHPFQRNHNVSSPSLFAVRQWGKGRVGLLNQWRQFSLGSGSRWLYDNILLSRGIKGLPSDMGQLFENSWRWLAEPSLNGGVLGGWVHGAETYAWPNDTPQALEHAKDITNSYDVDFLWQNPIDPTLKTVRGLVGARTALTGGAGSLAQFALAAKAAKLDFLVLLEDFKLLAANNGSKFTQMLADCKKHSDSELLILPGYRIKNNIARGQFAKSKGNDMMIYGPQLVLPPATSLTPDGTQINLQQFTPNSTTNYTGVNGGASYGWLLSSTHQPDGIHYPYTAGYFNLNDRQSAGGMSMVDLRLEGAAAIKTYLADGSSQDLTDDFILTAESTIGSVPMAVSEVLSPAALTAAVRKHALVYLRVHDLSEIFSGASPMPPAGEYIIPDDGGLRGISDCHFLVQLDHFIPGFLSYSVAVFLK
jgi:hypothetical protein